MKKTEVVFDYVYSSTNINFYVYSLFSNSIYEWISKMNGMCTLVT
jgi:hypothetical protein